MFGLLRKLTKKGSLGVKRANPFNKCDSHRLYSTKDFLRSVLMVDELVFISSKKVDWRSISPIAFSNTSKSAAISSLAAAFRIAGALRIMSPQQDKRRYLHRQSWGESWSSSLIRLHLSRCLRSRKNYGRMDQLLESSIGNTGGRLSSARIPPGRPRLNPRGVGRKRIKESSSSGFCSCGADRRVRSALWPAETSRGRQSNTRFAC